MASPNAVDEQKEDKSLTESETTVSHSFNYLILFNKD